MLPQEGNILFRPLQESLHRCGLIPVNTRAQVEPTPRGGMTITERYYRMRGFCLQVDYPEIRLPGNRTPPPQKAGRIMTAMICQIGTLFRIHPFAWHTATTRSIPMADKKLLAR